MEKSKKNLRNWRRMKEWREAMLCPHTLTLNVKNRYMIRFKNRFLHNCCLISTFLISLNSKFISKLQMLFVDFIATTTHNVWLKLLWLITYWKGILNLATCGILSNFRHHTWKQQKWSKTQVTRITSTILIERISWESKIHWRETCFGTCFYLIKTFTIWKITIKGTKYLWDPSISDSVWCSAHRNRLKNLMMRSISIMSANKMPYSSFSLALSTTGSHLLSIRFTKLKW